MASTIQMKRSAVAAKVPTTAQLALGEIAINTADGRMFIKKSDGTTESIVEVGANPVGDFFIQDKIVHAGDTNTAIRFPAADTVTVETAGAERMRVSATGNVGIGASNPAFRLVVQDTENTRVRITDGTTILDNLVSSGLGYVGTASSSPLLLMTGLVERARIDADGTFVFNGAVKEKVHALSGTTPALDPLNGTIQTWTLTGNSVPTDSIVAGESLTLLIDDGSGFSITWPSVTWKTNGGVAPTLLATGLTVIVLWKVGTVLYGARVGDA